MMHERSVRGGGVSVRVGKCPWGKCPGIYGLGVSVREVHLHGGGGGTIYMCLLRKDQLLYFVFRG